MSASQPPPPPSPPTPPRPTAGNARLVVLTLLLIVVIVVGGIVVFTVVVRDAIFDDGPPSCDAAPTTLGWAASDRGWRRTSAFTLDGPATVQVDVRLFATDGGVIQLGWTVYAVPAGEPYPDVGESSSTTDPFRGVRVGIGRDAVNEQVRLDAGTWELMTNGGAGPAEVRWPC